MTKKKSRTPKQKMQPGFSPKPVRRARALAADESPSPSPSQSPDPITESPWALGRKKKRK
jgi:hypothetical protein